MKVRNIVVGVVLFLGAAVCSAQSLGELAKKVAAEKAAKDKDSKVKPTTKTLTNKDLGATGDGATPAAPDMTSPAIVVAAAPVGAIREAVFEPLYRAARAIPGATSSGVSYVTFRALLQAMSTELAIVQDHVPLNGREQVLHRLYTTALSHYEISATLWKMKIDSSDAVWNGEIPFGMEQPGQTVDTTFESLATTYGIPVSNRLKTPPIPQPTLRYKALPGDAMKYVWLKGAETVDAASALFVGR
jgi:hypothetical protein